MQTDFLYANYPKFHRFHFRTIYFFFVGFFTLMTTITLPLAQPGDLIIIRGVIAFLAMGIICPGLIYLNYVRLPRAFPSWVKPHPFSRAIMVLIALVYIGVGCWYIFVRLSG